MSAADREWPQESRYFVPQLVNAEWLREIVEHRFDYLEADAAHHQVLNYIDFSNNKGATLHEISQLSDEFEERFENDDIPSEGTRCLFVYYKRHYDQDLVRSSIFLQLPRWFQILNAGMVLPSIIELLLDNNGGLASHVSYCGDNPSTTNPCGGARSYAPCAYHIIVKKGDHGYGEGLIYARYDFHTKKTLMLLFGRLANDEVSRLLDQFGQQPSVHIFAIIHALLSIWSEQIETVRARVDVETQQLESQTGHGTMFFRAKPLSPDQLTLRRDISITADRLRLLAASSSYMAEIFDFLSSQVRKFGDLCAGAGDSDASSSTLPLPLPPLNRQLGDAFAQRHSQSSAQVNQIRGLSSRVEAQWNIVNALLSQHNNRLNTDMARDSRIDNVLMRKISFVTIVFLPATFMSTFFSMSFFIIDESHFRVNKMIWLYVVCTVPLTIVLAFLYGRKNANSSREMLTGLRRRLLGWRRFEGESKG